MAEVAAPPRDGADVRDPRRRASTSCRSTAAASLYDVAGDGVERHAIDAAALGLQRRAPTAAARRRHARRERAMIEAVLRGEPGARRDVVLLNAGRRAARRRRGRADRGGHRAGGADHRRRARRRAARAAARGTPRGRGGRRRPRRRRRPRARPRRRQVGADRRRDALAARNVVGEIAARRRADSLAELAARPSARHRARGGRAPPRADRRAARRARPPPHRRDQARARRRPGRIAAAGDDIVARARAYEAGGAAAISVLCEPHWFGGSVDDLRAVRAAVSRARSWPRSSWSTRASCRCSAPPAPTLVLLLAVLHPRSAARPARRPARSSSASSRSSRPTTSASSSGALATGARLIGINNRDLRTLDGRPRAAGRLRELVPDDRLVDRRVRRPRRRRRSRAGGRSGSMARSSARPSCGRRIRRRPSAAFVAAGPAARRPGQRRAPAVRQDLRRHRRRTASSRRSAPAPTRSG